MGEERNLIGCMKKRPGWEVSNHIQQKAFMTLYSMKWKSL